MHETRDVSTFSYINAVIIIQPVSVAITEPLVYGIPSQIRHFLVKPL